MSPDRNRAITTSSNGQPGASWPRAVVFDCDGLLVDTSHCWLSAYEATLGRAIGEVELATLAGASARGAAARLGVSAEELGAALAAAYGAGPLELLPGAATLLAQLDSGRPLAVATNCPEPLARQALTAAGVAARFEVIVSAEPLHDKPAPDVYLAACRQLGVHPQDAVALEDSPIGVDSARAAGLTVVYVPSRSAAAAADLAVGRLDDPQLLSLLRAEPVLTRGRT